MTDPRYTDPLHAPGDEPTHERLQLAYERGLADGAHTRILSLVVALVLGAILASTFLLANHVLAAPRSAPDTEPGSGSAQGRSEAPSDPGVAQVAERRSPFWQPEAAGATPVSGVNGGASSEPSAVPPPLAAPTQLDDGGGIAGTAPPDTAVDLAHGTASFVGPSFGARYLALPSGRGVAVRICSAGRCVARVSTDAGPDRAMQRKGRVADLSFLDFRYLCRCSPYAVGLIRVTVEGAGGAPTVPPTDVAP